MKFPNLWKLEPGGGSSRVRLKDWSIVTSCGCVTSECEATSELNRRRTAGGSTHRTTQRLVKKTAIGSKSHPSHRKIVETGMEKESGLFDVPQPQPSVFRLSSIQSKRIADQLGQNNSSLASQTASACRLGIDRDHSRTCSDGSVGEQGGRINSA